MNSSPINFKLDMFLWMNREHLFYFYRSFELKLKVVYMGFKKKNQFLNLNKIKI